jgi:hypothetical protein
VQAPGMPVGAYFNLNPNLKAFSIHFSRCLFVDFIKREHCMYFIFENPQNSSSDFFTA